MSEMINCPFCGNLIESDAIKCKNCDALFKEPQLSTIRFKEFAPFFAINFLTFGLFSIIWFFINGKAINNLADSKKDYIKYNSLLVVLTFGIFVVLTKNLISSIATVLVLGFIIALSYRTLRIIQKYTEKTYGVTIDFNPYYLLFFNIFYMIHYIDTYTDRVLNVHEHFNRKSPYVIFLFILMLIQIFIISLYHNLWVLQYLPYINSLD